MKISKLKGSNKRSGLCRLGVTGDMTIYAAEQMLKACTPYLDDYKAFELDLSDVGEIDTAGIQLLLLFERKSRQSKKHTRLVDSSEAVNEVLNIYRLSERFNAQALPQ